MKKHLLSLFLSLCVLSGFSQGIQNNMTISPGPNRSGTPYTVKTIRDISQYPLTVSGLNSFTAALVSGAFNLTVTSSGCVIPAGTRPGLTPPTCSQTAPSWVSGFRYSNDGTTVTYEAAGPVGKLKFEDPSGTAFNATNPDGVPIPSGQFLSYGTLTGQSPYDRQWQINRQGPIRVTAQQEGGTATFTYNLTPQNPASRVVLTAPASGGGSSGGGSSGGGSGNTVAYNKPSFETFDYQPITTNPSWESYDSRSNTNGVLGWYNSLTNGTVNVRIYENHGATPTHISGSDGRNLINLHDLGTMNGGVFYRNDPITTNANPVIDTQWQGVKNNPIQHGNAFGQYSEVVAKGKANGILYSKTHLRNWAVRDEYTDAYFEQWVKLDSNYPEVVHVYGKLLCNRADAQDFKYAIANEIPCVYGLVENYWAAYTDASGNVQFTSTFDNNENNPIYITPNGNWVARVKSNNLSATGLGLWTPGFHKGQIWTKSNQQGGDEFQNGSSYVNNGVEQHFDWNGQYYYHWAFIVGTAGRIKTVAEGLGDPRNTFAWKFNQYNGRGNFRYDGGRDSGYPTPADGIEVSRFAGAGTGQVRIYSPFYGKATTGISNLYVRMKSSGGSSTRSFVFVKLSQSEGDAEASQSITFNVTNDNQWHTYTIPVSTNDNWNGSTINYYSIRDYAKPEGAVDKIQWINTADADPEP